MSGETPPDPHAVAQDVLMRMRHSHPAWEHLIKMGSRYQEAMKQACIASGNFFDAFTVVGEHARQSPYKNTVALGEGLIEVAETHKMIAMNNERLIHTLNTNVLIPLSKRMDGWKKQLNKLEGDYDRSADEHKKRVKKAEKDMEKATKAARKMKEGSAATVRECTKSLESTIAAFEKMRQDSLENVLSEEHVRYVRLMARFGSAMKAEIAVHFGSEKRLGSMYDRWMALAGVQRSTSAQDVNRSMGGQGSKDERDEVYEDPDSLVGEGPSGSVCFPVGLQKRYLVAQYDYTSFTKDQLTMNKGDRIVALTPEDDGWVFGQNIVDNSKGWFPAGYVIDADAADHALYPTSFGPGSPPSARKGASGGSSGNTLSSPPTSSTNKGGSLGRQTGQDTLSSLASSDKSTQKKPGRRTQSHMANMFGEAPTPPSGFGQGPPPDLPSPRESPRRGGSAEPPSAPPPPPMFVDTTTNATPLPPPLDYQEDRMQSTPPVIAYDPTSTSSSRANKTKTLSSPSSGGSGGGGGGGGGSRANTVSPTPVRHAPGEDRAPSWMQKSSSSSSTRPASAMPSISTTKPTPTPSVAATGNEVFSFEGRGGGGGEGTSVDTVRDNLSNMGMLVSGPNGRIVGTETGSVRLVRSTVPVSTEDSSGGVKVPDWMGGGRVNPTGNKVHITGTQREKSTMRRPGIQSSTFSGAPDASLPPPPPPAPAPELEPVAAPSPSPPVAPSEPLLTDEAFAARKAAFQVKPVTDSRPKSSMPVSSSSTSRFGAGSRKSMPPPAPSCDFGDLPPPPPMDDLPPPMDLGDLPPPPASFDGSSPPPPVPGGKPRSIGRSEAPSSGGASLASRKAMLGGLFGGPSAAPQSAPPSASPSSFGRSSTTPSLFSTSDGPPPPPPPAPAPISFSDSPQPPSTTTNTTSNAGPPPPPKLPSNSNLSSSNGAPGPPPPPPPMFGNDSGPPAPPPSSSGGGGGPPPPPPPPPPASMDGSAAPPPPPAAPPSGSVKKKKKDKDKDTLRKKRDKTADGSTASSSSSLSSGSSSSSSKKKKGTSSSSSSSESTKKKKSKGSSAATSASAAPPSAPAPPPPPPLGGGGGGGGGPPPPPPPPAASSSGAAPSALLTSIHKGAKLKKTVTVDKSGPALSGRVL